MKFASKHYKEIAEIIKGTSLKAYQVTHTKDMVGKLADMFESDNPRFDRGKFLLACGVE